MAETAVAMEMATPTTGQKLGAEVLGTFVLVFLGVGSVVIAGAAGAASPISVPGIALAFGIAVFVMASAVGRLSGGHFNPAVSVGAAMGGRVPWSDVPGYVLAQVVGGALGAFALFGVAEGYPGFAARGRMGANSFGSQGTGIAWWAALLLETILTLLFVLVILGVTDSRSQHPGLAPLAIGLTLTAIHLVAIPATGTSVNPARSIGPALFGGTEALKQLWLFIVAPLLGGALGGLVYPAMFGHGTEPVAGSGLRLGGSRAAAVPGYVVPDAYQQQWNQEPGQAPWGQQPQQPAPPAQGWPQPGQAPYPPQQPWSAPPPQQPGYPPAQQPGQGWPSQPPAPGTTPGTGEEPDDGRTQIRPQQ